MKHYKKIHLGFLCLFVGLIALSAQQSDSYMYHQIPKPTKALNNQQHSYEPSTPAYYRHHKKLGAIFSGIVIELVASDLPLKRDFPLFQQFGNIYYDQLDEGGYAYCILTNFSTLYKAKNYLKKMILHRAPEAKIVKYHLGKRKKEVQ